MPVAQKGGGAEVTHAHPPLQARARPDTAVRPRRFFPQSRAQAFVYACVLSGLRLAEDPVRHRSGQPSEAQDSLPAPQWGRWAELWVFVRLRASVDEPTENVCGPSRRLTINVAFVAASWRGGGVGGWQAEVKGTGRSGHGAAASRPFTEHLLCARRCPPRLPASPRPIRLRGGARPRGLEGRARRRVTSRWAGPARPRHRLLGGTWRRLRGEGERPRGGGGRPSRDADPAPRGACKRGKASVRRRGSMQTVP